MTKPTGTTAKNVTDEQIKALRATGEPRADVCDAALEGDKDARAECARVIAEAEEKAKSEE